MYVHMLVYVFEVYVFYVCMYSNLRMYVCIYVRMIIFVMLVT